MTLSESDKICIHLLGVKFQFGVSMGLRDMCCYVVMWMVLYHAVLLTYSTDLGLQMYKTCMHTLALGIGHILVNTTKGLNFSLEIQAWRKYFQVDLENYNS